MIKPNVKIGDLILRRKSNGGELDTWVECRVNKTYLKLINDNPNNYRQLDGSNLEMIVEVDIPEKIVKALGRYVNGLDRRHLGMPMMDELAVMQMKHIVGQILDNPNADVELPEYD